MTYRKGLARALRKGATDAEKALWRGLRSHRLEGLQFRRQHPIGPYVVDFVCIEKKLVIELDGGQHVDQEEADARRSRYLEQRGYRVLRFWDDEVLTQGQSVLAVIWESLAMGHKQATPSSPSPPQGGGEGIPPMTCEPDHLG